MIQRCQVHKRRNLQAVVPQGRQAYVLAALSRAYRAASADAARRQLRRLVAWLYPPRAHFSDLSSTGQCAMLCTPSRRTQPSSTAGGTSPFSIHLDFRPPGPLPSVQSASPHLLGLHLSVPTVRGGAPMTFARTTLVALFVLFSCDRVSEAIPVFDDTFTSTSSTMSLTLSGAAVLPATAGGPVAFSHVNAFWNVQGSIRIRDNFNVGGVFRDQVEITGTARHLNHPLGDGQTGPGNLLPFMFLIQGIAPGGVALTPPGGAIKSHGTHSDVETLSGARTAGPGGQIVDWTATTKVDHDLAPVPEPATLTLFSLTALGLLRLVRRRDHRD